MVKVRNIFGDEYKGKQAEKIFQKKYGQQIRREGFKREYESTPWQVAQMERFRKGVEFWKSLSYEQKEKLKKYYKEHVGGYIPGVPGTWVNWVKVFAMQVPRFEILDKEAKKYRITHQGIKKVTEKDVDGNVVFEANGLSDIDELRFQKTFEQFAKKKSRKVEVTTLAGIMHIFEPAEWIKWVSCFEEGCFQENCFERWRI